MTPNPNPNSSPNTNAYGSDANVSVGYSAYATNYPNGYGTLDGGTGDGLYSNQINYTDGSYDLLMTFTAAPGYTVTLDSFDLALYLNKAEKTNITVTGGASAYALTGVTPSGSTFTTYSPDVTGTSLTLDITNLFDIGLNNIVYSETALPAPTPEPSSAILMLTGILALVGMKVRFPRLGSRSGS